MENNQIPNVSNEKVEEAIREYAKDRTMDNLTKVVNLLRPTGLYVPAMLNDDKKPVPFFLKSSEGDQYLAAFTSPNQASDDVKQKAVMIMPFTVCNGIVANDQFDLKGMVINPYTDNLILRTELVKQLHEADVQLAQNLKDKKGPMSPEQQVQYMRNQIEFGVMPKHMFTDGEQFIGDLCKKKEAAVLELFEESFHEQNPFDKDDFSVMALTISSELMLVRIDMPEGKNETPFCLRIYLTWNPQTKDAGYYTIEVVPNHEGRRLGCIDVSGQHTDLEEAPVEGVEMQRILELKGVQI
jgi:hypothetical protein